MSQIPGDKAENLAVPAPARNVGDRREASVKVWKGLKMRQE